jgi:hypothetical protein
MTNVDRLTKGGAIDVKAATAESKICCQPPKSQTSDAYVYIWQGPEKVFIWNVIWNAT